MLQRYSRTRNATNGQLANGVDAGGIPNTKPPGIEVYEKHVQEMSKLLEESQRKIDQASLQSKKHDGIVVSSYLEGAEDIARFFSRRL